MKHLKEWTELVEREYDYTVSITYGRGFTAKAKDAESLFKEIDGIQGYHFKVNREYDRLCMFCGYTAEVAEDDCPVCCQEAMESWEKAEEQK